MKQLLETMCGGDFLSKNPDEAMDFLSYVAETSKAWDEPNSRETDRMRPTANKRGGMYSLPEDMEMRQSYPPWLEGWKNWKEKDYMRPRQ